MRRFLSLLLTVALVLTAFVIPASAAEESTTLKYFVKGIGDGDVIVVEAEASRTITVVDAAKANVLPVDATGVSKVEFYNITTESDETTEVLLGEDNAAPYECNVAFENPGTYTLKTVVYDTDSGVETHTSQYTVVSGRKNAASYEQNFDTLTTDDLTDDFFAWRHASTAATAEIENGTFKFTQIRGKNQLTGFALKSAPINTGYKVHYYEYEFSTTSANSYESSLRPTGNDQSINPYLLNGRNTSMDRYTIEANTTYKVGVVIDYNAYTAIVRWGGLNGTELRRVDISAFEGSENGLLHQYVYYDGTILTVDNYKYAVYEPITEDAYYVKGIGNGDVIVAEEENTRTITIVNVENADVLSVDAIGVSKVEFYNGDNLLETVDTAPYEYNLPTDTPGTYTLKTLIYGTNDTVETHTSQYTVVSGGENSASFEQDFDKLTTADLTDDFFAGKHDNTVSSVEIVDGALKFTNLRTKNAHVGFALKSAPVATGHKVHYYEFDVTQSYNNTYWCSFRPTFNDQTAANQYTVVDDTQEPDKSVFAANETYKFTVVVDYNAKTAIIRCDGKEFRRLDISEWTGDNIFLQHNVYNMNQSITIDNYKYSVYEPIIVSTSDDYLMKGIEDGDHIVKTAEPSRMLRIIDNADVDPDNLADATATDIEKVEFMVDGSIVATATSAPYQHNLIFGDAGEHNVTALVYTTDETKLTYGPYTYTVHNYEIDDTHITFEENFDGDTNGSGLYGANKGGKVTIDTIESGALKIGTETGSSAFGLHPVFKKIPKTDEVYYMEFDISFPTSPGGSIAIRDAYYGANDLTLFAFTSLFSANKTYNFKIIFDFYTNYAIIYVDGYEYTRVSLAAHTANAFYPQFDVGTKPVKLDNFKFTAYDVNPKEIENEITDDNPIMILRFDDLGKLGSVANFNRVEYLMNKYGATGGFGVIGSYLDNEAEADKAKVIDAIKGWNERGIEIWSHGYTHSTTEYSTESYDAQKENFGKTMDLLKETCGITITSFGSPYNHATDTTIQMIQENYPDIICIHNTKSHAVLEPEKVKIANFGEESLGKIEPETGVVDYELFVERFEQKKSNDYLLLLSHPGGWSDESFVEFELVLRYLADRGVTFMTPTQAAKDLIANKTYKFTGIEEGDRIVVAKESSRKLKVIDNNDYKYNPAGLANAKATLVSSVDFIVDGEVAYTATSSPFEYDLPFNDYGVHTVKAIVHKSMGGTKTYGPYTYTTLEAAIDSALTVEEDFASSQDASAIHGGVYGSGLSFAVEGGVLKTTATGGAYNMNLHPSVDKLSVQDRIYFMEYDFKIDSDAYQTRLYMNDATADGYTRAALEVTKNYDFALDTWHNVKVMIDPDNNEAITYVNNNEYQRIALSHLVKDIFIPELMVNRKNVYLDNYKFYAYDLAEKAEATNPVVILRFDDLRPDVIDAFESAIAVLDKYDIDASCGVIGKYLGDADLYEAIKTFHQNGAEIWHHGYEHTGTEFEGATAESVIENYGKTANLIKDNCGITITSLCPGYNNLDSAAIRVLQENYPELKCVMSSQDSEDAATTVVNLRATTTFEGDTDTASKIDIDGFKAGFEVLKHNEYVVIYCHPGSWKTGDLDKFDEIIQYLLEQGAIFMQPTKAAEHYNSIYRNPDTHIAKLEVNNDGLLYLSSKHVPESSTVYVAAYDDDNRFMYATTLTLENGISQEKVDLSGVDTIRAFVLDNETVAPNCGSKEYMLN